MGGNLKNKGSILYKYKQDDTSDGNKPLYPSMRSRNDMQCNRPFSRTIQCSSYQEVQRLWRHNKKQTENEAIFTLTGLAIE